MYEINNIYGGQNNNRFKGTNMAVIAVVAHAQIQKDSLKTWIKAIS